VNKERNLALLGAAMAACLLMVQGCSWRWPERNDTANLPEPANLAKTEQLQPAYNFAPYSTAIYAELQRNTFSKTGYDTDPDISRDGRWLVYVSDSHSGNPDIYLKTLTGESMVQKTMSPANDIQPCFSPDGKYLAFASDRNGNYDIFIMPTDKNGSLWQVTRTSADDVAPSWSWDGKRLAFSSRTSRGEWELWIIDLKTRSLTNLGPGLNPDWHPSKDLIAFQRPYYNGALSYSIYTIDTEGKNLTLLVRGERWVPTCPSWSPDGSRIAFAVTNTAESLGRVRPINKANEIWMVNVDGSQELRVTEGTGHYWTPTWARINAEERIYFASDRDNTANIWSVRCSRFPIAESPTTTETVETGE